VRELRDCDIYVTLAGLLLNNISIGKAMQNSNKQTFAFNACCITTHLIVVTIYKGDFLNPPTNEPLNHLSLPDSNGCSSSLLQEHVRSPHHLQTNKPSINKLFTRRFGGRCGRGGSGGGGWCDISSSAKAAESLMPEICSTTPARAVDGNGICGVHSSGKNAGGFKNGQRQDP
jgi:hypothetical protein